MYSTHGYSKKILAICIFLYCYLWPNYDSQLMTSVLIPLWYHYRHIQYSRYYNADLDQIGSFNCNKVQTLKQWKMPFHFNDFQSLLCQKYTTFRPVKNSCRFRVFSRLYAYDSLNGTHYLSVDQYTTIL